MNTSPHLSASTIKICRGVESCPHAGFFTDIRAPLKDVIRRSGWSEFLTERTHLIRHHHQFRVAVAACPNGCSNPHIADFGLLTKARIHHIPQNCSGCGGCVRACSEDALCLTDTLTLDQSRCLGCTACVRACPEEALTVIDTGYRVLLGGKLGRHPRLAHELGVFTLEQALTILERTLALFMRNYRPGLRLGGLVNLMGLEAFNEAVRP